MNIYLRQHSRGVSFVELLVAASIMAVVFGGLIATFQLMVNLIGKSKAEAGALSLANERLEYIRSLPYNSVGTVGGIPDGPIAQNATTTLNGITYAERVLIQYVDAPDDGTGAGDVNGILADYKRVKVEFTWSNKGVNDSISLVSNIVPRGIETTAGGGTLTVNVFDALVQPVLGAEVNVYNDTTTSTINTTVFTNAAGIAMFAGAPAAANYQLTVTKPGYSTDQTYSATTSNPSPTTPHVAVIESEVSTMNFQIDILSSLNIETVGVPTTASWDDSFGGSSLIASSSNITVTGGGVILSGGAGSYDPTGWLRSTSTSPGSFTAWEAATINASTTASTSVVVQVYEVSGDTYTLVPDADLPGNSTGFTAPIIDLSALTDSAYPELALGATLSTTDANVTPELFDWVLSYTVSEPAIGNIDFTLAGNKTIGTGVYKYQESHQTDGGGDITIADIEWDTYDIALATGVYDIAEACPTLPYPLGPGLVETIKLKLDASVTHSLRVRVEDTSGNAIPGADVDLTRTGFSESETTSVCGQVFFNSGVGAHSDYQLDVSASGYMSEVVNGIDVSGTTYVTVILNT